MQRQSLGSPVSKLHGHGGAKDESVIATISDGDESKQRKLDLSADAASSSSSSAAKPRRSSISPPPAFSPDRLIHAIPILTLLCFLVLFLFSHSPSQSEMSQIKGFNWPSKHTGSSAESEIGDSIGRFSELRRNDALAIRSLRNLREIQNPNPNPRRHRKHADF